jgi:hypothetical protein
MKFALLGLLLVSSMSYATVDSGIKECFEQNVRNSFPTSFTRQSMSLNGQRVAICLYDQGFTVKKDSTMSDREIYFRLAAPLTSKLSTFETVVNDLLERQ